MQIYRYLQFQIYFFVMFYTPCCLLKQTPHPHLHPPFSSTCILHTKPFLEKGKQFCFTVSQEPQVLDQELALSCYVRIESMDSRTVPGIQQVLSIYFWNESLFHACFSTPSLIDCLEFPAAWERSFWVSDVIGVSRFCWRGTVTLMQNICFSCLVKLLPFS